MAKSTEISRMDYLKKYIEIPKEKKKKKKKNLNGLRIIDDDTFAQVLPPQKTIENVVDDEEEEEEIELKKVLVKNKWKVIGEEGDFVSDEVVQSKETSKKNKTLHKNDKEESLNKTKQYNLNKKHKESNDDYKKSKKYEIEKKEKDDEKYKKKKNDKDYDENERYAIPKQRKSYYKKNHSKNEDPEQKIREEAKQKELDKKYEKWKVGEAQTAQREEKLKEIEEVVKEGFTRSADDESMNKYLKEKIYDELDPMANYFKTKTSKVEMKKGIIYPKYQGNWVPNRFGIPPGYRWDGVNRSNGFEAKIAMNESNKKAKELQTYRAIAELGE